jgi:hypothetical protein
MIRRPLRWIRRVIADTGEQEPVPVHLEREPGGQYVFRLGLRAGLGHQEGARIPIGCRPNPSDHPLLKEIHECEVAGQRLEAANLHALRAKVARLLEGIAPARSLPLCYFRAPAMGYELPVYEDRGGLVCPVIGGPSLKARDLAEIRAVACRYLVSAGYVAEPEEVEVDVVRPRDLSRMPPAAVLRSEDDPGFWLPCVEGRSPDGPVVGAVAHPAALRGRRLRLPRGGVEDQAPPAAPDLVALLRFLRSELARVGAPAAAGLVAAQAQPEAWAAAEERTEDAGVVLEAHLADADGTRLELPVRRTGAGDLTVAVEDRGINVFLAPDAEGLALQVGRHLVADGFLRFAQEVEVQVGGPPRPEFLDLESIATDLGEGTSGAPGADASGSYEEVHRQWP